MISTQSNYFPSGYGNFPGYVKQTPHGEKTFVLETPENPNDEVQLVKDLYESSRKPTLRDKRESPYHLFSFADGAAVLRPHDNVKGEEYVILNTGEIGAISPEGEKASEKRTRILAPAGTFVPPPPEVAVTTVNTLAKVVTNAKDSPRDFAKGESGYGRHVDKEEGAVVYTPVNLLGAPTYIVKQDGSVEAKAVFKDAEFEQIVPPSLKMPMLGKSNKVEQEEDPNVSEQFYETMTHPPVLETLTPEVFKQTPFDLRYNPYLNPFAATAMITDLAKHLPASDKSQKTSALAED